MKNANPPSTTEFSALTFFSSPSPATVSEVITPALPGTTVTREFLESEMDSKRLEMIISGKLHCILIEHAKSYSYRDQAKNSSDYEEILGRLLALKDAGFETDEKQNDVSDIANDNTYILMFFYLEQYLESTPEMLTKINLSILLLSSFSFANKMLNDGKFTTKELLEAVDIPPLQHKDISLRINDFSIRSLELSSCYVSTNTFDAYKANFLNYQSPYSFTEVIELPVRSQKVR